MSVLCVSARQERRSSGQAMVETVIVMPVFIFFILGTIQLGMMHQARIMLEYAAFNAARSGAVYNGDRTKMERVALMSLIASRPSWPLTDGTAMAVGPISDWKSLATEGLKVMAMGKIKSDLGIPIVQVDILSPTEEDFGPDGVELDFDVASETFSERRLGQLTIRVTYFYNLAIPFANSIIWHSWWSTRAVRSGYNGQNYKDSAFLAFKDLELTYHGRLAHTYDDGDRVFGMFVADAGFVSGAAGEGRFYIPLETTHTIRMQSNAFKCAIAVGESCPES